MTRAMLLCAGLSTRLGELSGERPKPLLPVCDYPIVRFGVANLVARGIKDIVINVHHQGDLLRDELGDGSELGARIQYSCEDELLGTGGGLKRALALLDPDGADEPFLSLNGKLIFDLDLDALLKAHAENGDTLGTMVVQPAPNAMKWGAVDVRPEGHALRVHNILGEGGYMFCGVHITRPSVVRRLPEGPACMVRQGYLPWLQSGERVSAFVHKDGYFAEHSTPKRYLQSNFDLLAGRSLRYPPGVLVGVDEAATVHPSANIIEPVRVAAGATIGAGAIIGPDVVIGRGATVSPESTLQSTVVWPGATASGPHRQSIITSQTVLRAESADEVDG